MAVQKRPATDRAPAGVLNPSFITAAAHHGALLKHPVFHCSSTPLHTTHLCATAAVSYPFCPQALCNCTFFCTGLTDDITCKTSLFHVPTNTLPMSAESRF